jgi:hemolysin activation/secretion protein
MLGAEVPLNVAPLQDRLQVLQQDQRIQSIHAELRPGTQPGESQLNVRIDEKPPISVWLAFNNYLPQTIGAEQGLVTLAHQNLTGHGDILSFTYGYSEGLHPMIDTWYALPLNAYDTTLMFRYRKNDNTVVDKVFGPLNIVSKTDSYELSLRQPVYRSLTQEFALSLSMEQETSDSYLSGDPFSFYPGDVNGHSTVAPLRFSLDWTYRTQRQVIAARSRQTFGLHALGATYHPQGNLPDGQFFAWLGQVQYARILDFWDTQLLARIDIQRATDSLLPVEQIGVGGRYSVRGYRENFLVRDQAFIASLESRIPLIQNSRWADYVQFCQFLDYGEANNVKLPTPTPSDLSSIGLGLRWGASLLKLPFNIRAEAEIYWGYKLRHVDYYRYEGVQDDGIHYQIAITGFF